MTIPGVGPWTAAVWMVEVGDITQFDRKEAERLRGLDPSLKVSAGTVTSATGTDTGTSVSTVHCEMRRACLFGAQEPQQFHGLVAPATWVGTRKQARGLA